MSKYIDADKMIAEIERLKDHYPSWQVKSAVEDLSLFITVSQQEQPQIADASKMEQPEADLKKEIEKAWEKFPPKILDYTAFAELVAHFYELGLNARKEE